MPHSPLSIAACGLGVAVVALAGQAPVQSAGPAGVVSDVSLPGGLRAALAMVGDEVPPDRAQFLAEFIHRTYDTPFGPDRDLRSAGPQSLAAALSRAAPASGVTDTLPLPLPAAVWTEVVFGGRETPDTIVSAIVRSRPAALFYSGLLALDDDTREWLAGQPALVAELVSARSGAFLAAAPGLRIVGDSLRLPGGESAVPVWQALIGQPPAASAAFVRALVAADDGRVTAFLGAIAQLTPAQSIAALNLRSPDVKSRVEAARRMYGTFVRLLGSRTVEQRAFTRPPFDPVLLIAELAVAPDGRPSLPESRGLWRAVFDSGSDAPADEGGQDDQPVDLSWLCEQVFGGDPADQRRRYTMVLFASRQPASALAHSRRDAIAAIRGAGFYPALSGALERIGVADIGTVAAAVRQAERISAIGDDERAGRALAQFQGALALIARGTSRGSLTSGAASALVLSLSAVPLSSAGDYEGRLTEWLTAWVHRQAGAASIGRPKTPIDQAEDVLASAPGPVETDALRVLAGAAAGDADIVEWEGTRYRVDLARAEGIRLVKTLGHSPQAWLSSADASVRLAAAVSDPGLTRDGLRREAEALALAVEGDAEARAEATPMPRLRQRGVIAALRRAAAAGDLGAAPRLAPGLRLLADELTARGLTELAYAAALGDRDGIALAAGTAAERHDFGVRSAAGRLAPWAAPFPGADAQQRWRVSGALLGLEIGLAEFSLVRMSAKPPARRPTINDQDRRTFVEAVALMAPPALSDEGRDTIVAAMSRGRAIVAAARTSGDRAAIADAAGLSPQRRSLLPWVLANDPERAGLFLSPRELLLLGLEGTPVEALHAWGAPAGARLGCQCLRLIERRPWELFAGRGQGGMVASAFPDLNLRLAELLAELKMPAVLLPAVLGSATLDFVTSTISRSPDDRRGLVEFVQALRRERVEQYLALLTTDGPLFPIGESAPRGDAASAAWPAAMARPRR